MYTDGDNYPNIKKLPSELEDALEHLSNNEALISAFGEKTITSYWGVLIIAFECSIL